METINLEDVESFTKLVIGIGSVFGREFNDRAIELMYEALKKYPIQAIKMAATQFIKHGSLKRGDSLVALIEKELGQKEQDIALNKANNVLGLLSSIGSYGNPIFTDSVTAHLFKTRWNWYDFCRNMTVDKEPWFVKEFVKAYQVAKRIEPKLLIENSARNLAKKSGILTT
jgi:hypothetical protein